MFNQIKIKEIKLCKTKNWTKISDFKKCRTKITEKTEIKITYQELKEDQNYNFAHIL